MQAAELPQRAPDGAAIHKERHRSEQTTLCRTSVIDRRHLVGIVGGEHAGMSWLPRTPPTPPAIPAELLRPLEQYEAALGGAW